MNKKDEEFVIFREYFHRESTTPALLLWRDVISLVFSIKFLGNDPMCFRSHVQILIGLSKERPILDHHPKAQSEMRHFSYEMQCFSYEKHLKLLKTADSTQISHLDLVFHRVQREGHSWKVPLFMWKAPLFVKSAAFRKTTCKEL